MTTSSLKTRLERLEKAMKAQNDDGEGLPIAEMSDSRLIRVIDKAVTGWVKEWGHPSKWPEGVFAIEGIDPADAKALFVERFTALKGIKGISFWPSQDQ